MQIRMPTLPFMKNFNYDPKRQYNPNHFGANTSGLYNGINLQFETVQFRWCFRCNLSNFLRNMSLARFTHL